MKKGLDKTELTGIILLVLLIAAVTGCALLLKDCRGEEPDSPVYPNGIEVVDSSSPGQDVKEYTPSGKSTRKSAGKKSGGGKKSAARKSSSSPKSKSAAPKVVEERPDPFLDTIPLEWDDPEEFGV